MDIAILKGNGQYEAIEHFCENLGRALIEEGKHTKVFDLNSIHLNNLITILNSERPKLCISFNAIGFTINNNAYYKQLNLNHLAILIDHPIYHIPNLDLSYKGLFVSCVDYDRVAYLKDTISFKNSFLLHHGIDRNINYETENKEYDIVFLGSMYDFNKIRAAWQEKYNKSVNKILDAAIEVGMYNSFMPIEEMLNIALRYYNLNLNQDEIMDFHKELLPEIDAYLRFYHRSIFINNIKNHVVHIFGSGEWESCIDTSSAIIKPSVNMNEAIKIMQKSKITLNCTMTTFYNGSHERPLMAAMAGSAVLSNYSPFFEEVFKENAVLLNLSKMQDVDERIELILINDEKRIHMTDYCRNNVGKNHTWNNRAREIVNVLGV